MSRAEDLRALADQVEAHDRLVADYEQALDAHRTNPSDDTRAAFKAAARALADNRYATRVLEGRGDTMTVAGDAVAATPEG